MIPEGNKIAYGRGIICKHSGLYHEASWTHKLRIHFSMQNIFNQIMATTTEFYIAKHT